MRFDDVVDHFHDDPVLESAMLRSWAGESKQTVQSQLSRWRADDKVDQVRRGLYVINQPYRSVNPHKFVLARKAFGVSYVSFKSALSYWNMIPESTGQVRCATNKQSRVYDQDAGVFRYTRTREDSFVFRSPDGYEQVDLPGGMARVARPELAVLDRIMKRNGPFSETDWDAFRLSDSDKIDFDVDKLNDYAKRYNSDRLIEATDQFPGLTDQSTTNRSHSNENSSSLSP